MMSSDRKVFLAEEQQIQWPLGGSGIRRQSWTGSNRGFAGNFKDSRFLL